MYTALILLLAHLALGVILWLRVRKLYSYPGLLGFPVIGNLYYFYKTMFICTIDGAHRGVLAVFEEQKMNGIFFHFLAGYNIMAMITCPELVKKLSFHPNLADKPYAVYGGFKSTLGGPFQAQLSDEEWKTKRKEYNINLKKTRVDNDYFQTFLECADKMIDILLEEQHSGVDTHGVCASVAMDSSLRNLFGFETSLVYHPEVIKAFKGFGLLGSIMSTNPITMKAFAFLPLRLLDLFIGKLAELRKWILEDLDNKMKLNRPLQELPLSAHVATRLQKCNATEKELIKEIHEMVTVPAHTISSTLADMINFLAVLPDIQERAWQEQYQIFGNDSRDPTIEDLNQMQFLDRFMKESFRYLGPGLVSKAATADINVDGIIIPRNTVVFYHLCYIRFHPKYCENPNVFDPDRFLDESDLLKYICSPFGIGIRSCPGMYYATILIKVALSKMLRRLKVSPADKDFRFEDIKYAVYITTEMLNPPKLMAEKRI